jgi:hypothetical protein
MSITNKGLVLRIEVDDGWGFLVDTEPRFSQTQVVHLQDLGSRLDQNSDSHLLSF